MPRASLQLLVKCQCLGLMLLQLGLVAAAPQQQASNTNLDDRIIDIFGTNTGAKRGFGTVVTPEPATNAQQRDFQSVSGRAQCNCVSYDLCERNPNESTDDVNYGFGQIDIRFNNDDPNAPTCDHFLDVCCDVGSTANQSIITPPVETRPNRPMGCGIRNVGGIDFELKGANNHEAGFGEYPWTIALLHSNNSSYFCAGSLIHGSVVLTAAHCVSQKPLNSFIARAGEWDAQTTKERLPYQERRIRRVVIHPRYDARNVANDFAVVILESAYNLGDNINVVCLPRQNAVEAAGSRCFSSGWGKTSFGAEGRFSVILKSIPLPIVEFNECQNRLRTTRLGPKFALDRSFMCAGGEIGIDTCQGDGGAPLVCATGPPTDNRYHQSGIVAWGIGCNDPIPAAYASIATARNWIDDQVIANGFDPAIYTAP